jgi:HSP20 family protein
MEIERFGTHADLDELIAIRDRIDSLASLDLAADATTPRADLLDLGDALQLRLEVPGVPQEDLEVALQGQELLVAGIRETIEEGVTSIFSERPNGPFHRSVHLPAAVEHDAVTAHLRSGVLVVHLPKANGTSG